MILNMNRIIFLFLISGLMCCQSEIESKEEESPKGKLFIIGGGKRGVELVDRMITEADLRNGGYGFILPMSSSEPDSAIIWSSEQFWNAGIRNIAGFNFKGLADMSDDRLDSVKNANLIYISGGDQRRFMGIVKGSPLFDAIKEAYENGAVMAGTSAGAAVMSELMITGTELKYPEYNSTFRHLEHKNIELDSGMAFLQSAIIDQHFVRRSRYNRLLTAVAEFPNLQGIGIDESTAILIHQDTAEVVGISQVVTFELDGKSTVNKKGKIGLRNLMMDVYLPGEKFYIGTHD